MVARLMQLTARLRALSDLVLWITLWLVYRLTNLKEGNVGCFFCSFLKVLLWNTVVNLIHCSSNPYLSKWAAHRALQHKAGTKKLSPTSTLMLRLKHPLANAANEWESASRLTALILLHRLSCCSPETDQYHLLNTQEAWESIKGLLLSN